MSSNLTSFHQEYTPADVVRASIKLRDGEIGITDTILTSLACDIVEGRMAPGETINSVDIARRFKASRTPVREAFLRLEAAGLVIIPARQRPYIWNPSLSDVSDIYQIRSHLQKLVSELIVQRASEDGLNKLEYWQKRRERAVEEGDVGAYFWDNVVGQLIEVALTGNSELERVITSLGLRSLVLRHISIARPGRIAESCMLHRELFTLYKSRDQKTAAEIASQIVMAGFQAIRTSQVIQSEALALS